MIRRRAERAHPRGAPGQGLAEYALILALIALFVVVGLLLLGAGFGSSVSLATPTPASPAASLSAS
ncbi:MAG: hypothetical protein M0Z49_10255 [Chloroflexi bacterium]|nr:hypothetical protein [Chloroflexota bacterium]